MKISIYAVRDSAVEAFLQPFFSPTNAAAIRSVMQAVNDPQHEFAKHAKDYALYHLGEFHDDTGIVSSTDNGLPNPIIACIDLINKA